MAAGTTVKMSVNLSKTVVDALRSIANKRGISMTEALRRAISTEKFLMDETDGGSKILIEDEKHKIRQLLLR